MAMFNNTIGFKPEGKVLTYWTILPQVTSSFGKREIPALFGNLKNIVIYYIFVIALLAMEIVLTLNLNEAGVDWKVIVALSTVDFLIAVLPFIFELSPHYNKSIIKANIFIDKTKIKLIDKLVVPEEFKDDDNSKGKYLEHCQDSLKSHQHQKTMAYIVDFVFAFVIIGLGAYKFYNYYGVYGSDIFIEPVGRFIIMTVIISIITHILFTKYVVCHLLYYFGMKRQIKEFKNDHSHQIRDTEKNIPQEMNYTFSFKTAKSDNQMIRQKVFASTAEDKTTEIKSKDEPTLIRKDEIIGNTDVCIFYTGILLESEIKNLYASQKDDSAAEAIIAECKFIQISQLSN
ncbi:MAG: hypothetical protein NTX03_09345 [Bacteroidetes bacterium]|nr:hypothetical protein [Bacteroidota bacterium]